MRIDEDLRSVAMTMPLDAVGEEDRRSDRRSAQSTQQCSPLIPRLVVPEATAARACSIWTSFPLGEKTVSE